MTVIAVVNRKGGVGKSSVVAHLASELIALDVPVVALDGDVEERSLSEWANDSKGLLADFVRLLPSDDDGFLEAVEEAKKLANIVLIDCPPQNSEMSLTALSLADLVIVPCGITKLERKAAGHTLELIKEIQQEMNGRPKAYLLPYRLTNSNLSKLLPERLADLGKKSGKFEVLPGIKQSAEVQNATERGLTLWEYKPSSEVRKQFKLLAEFILKRSK